MNSMKRLEEVIKKNGLTVSKLESLANLGRGTLLKTFRGEKVSITTSVLERLMPFLPEIDFNYIFLGEKKPEKLYFEPENDFILDYSVVQDYTSALDFRKKTQIVPLYDFKATAGLVTLTPNNVAVTPSEFISIPNLGKADGAIFVVGDSMYPLVKAGDIVIYKIVDSMNDIFWGDMCLLELDLAGDVSVVVKYVQKSQEEGRVRLVSQNQHYQDKEILISQVKTIAKIKATVRYNSII
jgi:transcriptional regulator with XRE-family HTH domain